MSEFKVAEVFGVQREVPLNYVTRPAVDDVFVGSLTTDKHIVVHGSSKQGKTSLRKRWLSDREFVRVMCNSGMSLSQLLTGVLKDAGYRIELSSARTVSGESKVIATAEGSVGIPGLGAKIGGEETETDATEETKNFAPLELDPESADDIIRALRAIDFDRYIVLEDFHYLPVETQQRFATSLKAFHEESNFTFIVIGVWLDDNRLIQFNGDLTGRVLSVDADLWTVDELRQVVSEGERLLNISFDPQFVDDLLEGCFLSVHIVQEACFRACSSAGVTSSKEFHQHVEAQVATSEIIHGVVEDQSARYRNFLNAFADGFQQTKYEMYRWLLLPLLALPVEELENGVTLNRVQKLIDLNHPETPVNQGNTTQALGAAASLQVKGNIAPIIIDYDSSRRRLNVVDRGFITWLHYQDRAAELEGLGLPREPVLTAQPTIPEVDAH
ncbi:MAG: hypothetical protein ABJH68_15440 [Ilumatobacter sp.]|uniref:hypothetical protein n=1 Tax=Ilumatobacter sp. TaxID=1967498 RepID=UPI003297713C